MCTICSAFNPYIPTCEYDEFSAPEGADATTGPVAVPGETFFEAQDAAASTATAYSIDVGEFFEGTLSTTADVDWIAIDLVAGQQYTFALTGTGALFDSNDDPFLRLRNASGTEITLDDDGGPGRYSSLTYTAATSGTYYLDVSSWNNSDAGTYGLSAIEGARANYNAAMASGTLLRPDQAWTGVAGTGGAPVSWAFRQSGNSPDGATFVPLSAAQRGATETIMTYIEAISGLDFQQVSPGGSSNNATILFGAYAANDGSGAYAFYPGGTVGGDRSFGSNAGNVWLNNNSVSQSNLAFGTYSFFTILHEMGHAFGLAHPGDYNAAPGVSITYANNAQFMQDTHQYTVMSYFDETNSGASGGLSYPDTFMLHDYLAIHTLYGADTSYNGGNTRYGFNATESGSAYDFTANSNPFLTIYDGNGIDTIDLSGYSMDQVLSLVQGEFSDIGGYRGNVSIAYGAVIENATGGSGNDTITGNASANNIMGNAGNDEIMGGGGNDIINGGTGNDTAMYAGTYDDFVFSFTTDLRVRDTNSADGLNEGTDTLTSIEKVVFGDDVEMTHSTSGGKLSLTFLDAGNGYNWSSYEKVVSFAGVTESSEIRYDNLDVISSIFTNGVLTEEYRLDGSGTKSWSSIETIYNSSGILASRTVIDDDLDSTVSTYATNGDLLTRTWNDISDSEPWSTRAYQYEADGDVSQRYLVFDNTDILTENYVNGVLTDSLREDISDVSAWSTLFTEYDANRNATSQAIVYDDLDVITTTYANGKAASRFWEDVSDSFQWNTRLFEYDGSGKIERQFYDYDDGLTQEALYTNGVLQSKEWFDGGGTYDWVSKTVIYDPTGAVLDVEFVYDL